MSAETDRWSSGSGSESESDYNLVETLQDRFSSGSDSESSEHFTLTTLIEQKHNTEATISNPQRSDVWSDTEEPIEHTYVTSGPINRQRLITFQKNKYKQRKGCAKIIGYNPPQSTKYTPSLYNKYHILSAWHNFKGNISEFKGQHSAATDSKAWPSHVRKITKRSWKRYRHKCYKGSVGMKQLTKYILTHSKSHCEAKKRFRYNPDKPHYGVFPIWEQFHVLYYNLVAEANESRSVSFMQSNMRHVYKNVRIMSLLKQVMSNDEWQLLKICKFSRPYVYHVMVCKTHSTDCD